MLVCKFGGSALSDAEGFRRVRRIVEGEKERRVIVPSAPGKRGPGDEKITDLLYACQGAASSGQGFSHLFDRVAGRYRQIAEALGLPSPDGALRAVYQGLKAGATAAWAASRGEWLNALLLGDYLKLPFVDAAEVIRFDASGRLLAEETRRLLRERLGDAGAVLPGFYGADAAGTVHTFSRGGSDVTAALAAAALNADAYENWKDVRGVFAADPAVVPDARVALRLTYRMLRALSRLGAQVISDEAVAPARQAGIPLRIRSFLEAEAPGTLVLPAFGEKGAPGAVGVTSRAGLTLLRLECAGGAAALAGEALRLGLPLERMAADPDALCLLLRGGEGADALLSRAEAVKKTAPLAAVSVVGEGLEQIEGAARLTGALSGAGLSPLGLHQPPGGDFITALLPDSQREAAVRALYDAFLRE